MEHQEVELFLAISIDAQHRALGITKVTSGILNSSLVHPRETFRAAMAMGAAAIIPTALVGRGQTIGGMFLASHILAVADN